MNSSEFKQAIERLKSKCERKEDAENLITEMLEYLFIQIEILCPSEDPDSGREVCIHGVHTKMPCKECEKGFPE